MRSLSLPIASIVLLSFASIQSLADEEPDATPIVKALIETAAEDADADVRIAAFDILKRQPASRELKDLFWRGLDDESPKIQRLAMDQLVAWEGPNVRILTRLISILEERSDLDKRISAQGVQRHLVAIGAPAVPYLIESLKRDESNSFAIYALGDVPLGEFRETVVQQLSSLLKSKDKAVKLAALRSLDQIMRKLASGGLDPRYLAYYQKLLEKYDSNGDGSLTVDEWSKMSKDPAEADTDKDGKISVVELGKWSMPR